MRSVYAPAAACHAAWARSLTLRRSCGVLVGSGMGGLTVFQNSVQQLLTKARLGGLTSWVLQADASSALQGYKKITPFFIPYAITNMAGALLAIDLGFMARLRCIPRRACS